MWIVNDSAPLRWTWTPDDVRHFLVMHDDILVEAQGEWVHMYRTHGDAFRPEDPDNPGLFMADTNEHLDTRYGAQLADLSDDDLWAYMEKSAQDGQFSPLT